VPRRRAQIAATEHPRSDDKDLTELVRRIHRRVQAKSFKKTDFALALPADNFG
jgi:hypothetical protein